MELEHKTSVREESWLRYWRASLIDATRLQPSDRENKRWVVLSRALERGRIELMSGQHSLTGIAAGGEEVLIAPYVLRKRVQYGSAKSSRAREIYPCLIPALLEEDGRLDLTPRAAPPFFTREVLGPGIPRAQLVLASLEHHDEVSTRWATRWDRVTTWEEMFGLTQSFFREVCSPAWESSLKQAAFDWHKGEAVLIRSTSRGGAGSAIVSLIDDLLEQHKCPGALASLIPPRQDSTRELLWTPAQAHQALHKHLGHMSSIYALSTSQRQALSHFLHGKDRVFAINGPPGTGKTTLLHDVVASLFVQHALESKPPPIIVVSSTNNQAVTNVLDSMSEVGDVHLIPELATLGVYLASKGRAQEGQEHYLTAVSQRGSGLAPYALRGPDALGGQELDRLLAVSEDNSIARSKFVAMARARYGLSESMGVSEIMRWARAKIKELADWMKLGLETYLAQNDGLARVQTHAASKWWERVLDLFGLFGQRTARAEREFVEAMIQQRKNPSSIRGERLNEWEARGDTDPTSPQNWLDVNVRRHLFELAICYYEARFFVHAGERAARALQHNRNTAGELLEWWRHVAMLTPVLVTTMYSGPRFFQARDGSRLFDGIDLLIVDEAGQVTPEVGVGMMALAKRALVVGDTQQLEPVWAIPEPVDRANARVFRLASLRESRALGQTGAMASNGSLMQMAQQACSIEVPDFAPGALLREHRRCPEQIIMFCNELAYGGLIRPMKQNVNDGFLPHLGYAHIKGKVERDGAGSLFNRSEAYAIAEWLDRRAPELLAHYSTDRLRDVVAVVTPFRAQADLIREELVSFSKDLGACTVGTVHALQGAERPVVLFSSVYNTMSVSQSGSLFFDRGVSMLNVAASRAKSAFLVFGDMEVFKDFGRLPSSVLARHLLGSNGVEIPDVQTCRVKEKQLIRDLERHREALKWAIDKAKYELHIASPWMTTSALHEDQLPQRFAECIADGVKVHLYVDDAKHHKKREDFAAARSMLGDGVYIHDCDRLHSKLVICDESILISGSFNWLSSVRRSGSDRFKYHETSTIQFRSQTEVVGDWCQSLIDDLQQRSIEPVRWDVK